MYAWATARRIKPGKMAEFKKEWEAGPKAGRADPESGLRVVYFLQDATDRSHMIGLAILENKAAYERYVASATEARRKQAMSPHVDAVEWERFFEVTEY